MREWWARTTPEERAVYSSIVGFWVAILTLLWLVSTGRWP